MDSSSVFYSAMLADAAAADPRGEVFGAWRLIRPLVALSPGGICYSPPNMSVHCRTGHLNRGVDSVF
jgi:hypothetical protein